MVEQDVLLSRVCAALAIIFWHAALLGVPTQGAVNDNLVVYLRFDGSLDDSSARNNDAVAAAGGVFFLPAVNSDGVQRNPRFGSGALDLSYAAATEWATFPTSLVDLQFGDDVDFTITFSVMKVNATGSSGQDQVLLGSNDWSDPLSVGWGIAQHDAAWAWRFKGASGATHEFLGGTLPAGEWSHIAVTHNRDGFASFYQEGALLGSMAIGASGSLDVGAMGRTLNIGQDGTSRHQPYATHNLDDLGIWRRALSPNEVLAVARNEISSIHGDPFCASLDGDQDVDRDDYLVWNANVGFDTGTGAGTAESYAKGDLDFNGIIDLADFRLIFECSAPSGGVPEPPSLLLLAAGAAGLAMLRRRRKATRHADGNVSVRKNDGD